MSRDNLKQYTGAQLRQMAADCLRRREESWERSDTDGFLSQWASGLSAQLYERAAELADNNWLGRFNGLYEGDRRVAAREVTSTYMGRTQYQWLLTDAEAQKFGRRYVPCGRRSRVQRQLGLTERSEMAPAMAKVDSVGTGLSGNAWVTTYRTGDKWGLDATPVPVDNGSTN